MWRLQRQSDGHACFGLDPYLWSAEVRAVAIRTFTSFLLSCRMCPAVEVWAIALNGNMPSAKATAGTVLAGRICDNIVLGICRTRLLIGLDPFGHLEAHSRRHQRRS